MMDQNLQKVVKGAISALTLLLMLVSIFFGLKIAGEFDVIEENDYNTITVEGDHEIFSSPDIATISFTAKSENKDLTTAQTGVDRVVALAVDKIKDLGVLEEDIKTTYYNSYPRYDYNQDCNQYRCVDGERSLIAYEVTQTISLTIRDLSKVSPILAAVGSAGVSDISGPNFDIENRDELMQEVRKEAIKEAKEKAKVLSDDLGVKLGRIVSYYEGGYGVPIYSMSADMAKEASVAESFSPTIPEGQNRIYSSVSIVYKIK